MDPFACFSSFSVLFYQHAPCHAAKQPGPLVYVCSHCILLGWVDLLFVCDLLTSELALMTNFARSQWKKKNSWFRYQVDERIVAATAENISPSTVAAAVLSWILVFSTIYISQLIDAGFSYFSKKSRWVSTSWFECLSASIFSRSPDEQIRDEI